MMLTIIPPLLAAAQPESLARKIVLFGAVHLCILALTIVLPMAMSLLTRRGDRPRFARGLAVSLAALLIVDRVVALTAAYHFGRIASWADALPMHLCDWAAVLVVVALLTRRQLAYELAYFWGLAGTVQAILTPDIALDTPMILAVSFFVSHCGIVIGALFMTWGLKMRPACGAVLRIFGWTQVYAACAGTVDWTTGTNFGYLRAKPVHASLLDAFAAWPWYIVELEFVALLAFGLFYLPFWRGNRRAR